jgi:hypothetical protein
MPKLAPKKRTRRDAEQLVAALQAKIDAIKARAVRKCRKADPAIRYAFAAIRNIDKAMSSATDQVLRKTLEEARGILSPYLTLQGIVPAAHSGGRSSEAVEQTGASLVDCVKANPGQRGEPRRAHVSHRARRAHSCRA